jgi:hypothetical protein
VIGTKAVRQALYQKLNVSSVTTLLANGSASIHHAVAPATGSYPLIVFFKQSGSPVGAFGKQAYKSDLWTVKAVDRSQSSSRAEDIDAAINAVLDYQTLTVSGGSNIDLRRESDLDYLESEGDQQYRHVGATYRVAVEATS